MTIHCPPGEHIEDIRYRFSWWQVCAPDVPGHGLPWDGPHAMAGIVCAVLLLGFMAYLLWLAWVERPSKMRER